MRLLTRPWFAALLVGAILLAWAVTLAPWAPWHERTVADVRLDVTAPADTPRSARSAIFELRGGRTSISVSASAPPGSAALPADFMASVDWSLRRAETSAVRRVVAGSAALTGASPAPMREVVGGESVAGDSLFYFPDTPLLLVVKGAASAPAVFRIRITQPRDTVAGVSIPLVLVIVCVVLIGIPATTASGRRSKPVIFPPTHEHY